MLIKNGYLFTTCTNDFEKLDIRIENTKITEVDFNISPKDLYQRRRYGRSG